MAYDYGDQSPLEGACCAPCAAGGRCAALGALDKSGKPIGLKAQALVSRSAILTAAGPSSRLPLYLGIGGVGILALVLLRRRRRRR